MKKLMVAMLLHFKQHQLSSIVRLHDFFFTCLCVCFVFCLFVSQRLIFLTTPSAELPKSKQEQEKLLAVYGQDLQPKCPPTKEGYFPVDQKESHC